MSSTHENAVTVQLTVDGKDTAQKVAPDLTLLQFLRDHLGLMGAKDGCGQGHCGACTVITDGKATRACLVRMTDLPMTPDHILIAIREKESAVRDSREG
jgi:xanthine dehydrogenase iron-sulfur cluster and FAD-binding subunit A